MIVGLSRRGSIRSAEIMARCAVDESSPIPLQSSSGTLMLWLAPEFAARWSVQDPFAAVEAIDGRVYRQKEGRTTLSFTLGGRGYFLKLHRGVGWGEIVKNLLQLRAPVLGARNEFVASRRLADLGVDTLTPVAYGVRGINPARRYSFLITEELAGTVDLEAFCADWRTSPPARALKLAILQRLADVSRRMHGSGINHRDYYLCHFLLDPGSVDSPPVAEDLRCYLIDLHRAQIRRRTPRRWQVKDLAGLLFSALDTGLTRRDLLRFVARYSGRHWRDALRDEPQMWNAVVQRAAALYRRDHGAEPPLLPALGTLP